MMANMEREDRSRRENERPRNAITSRTNQSPLFFSRTASSSSTACRSPFVFRTQSPMSSWFCRRSRIARSSSRARRSGYQSALRSSLAASGPFTVRVAVRVSRSIWTSIRRLSPSGVRATPCPPGRSESLASSRARAFTISANCCGFAMWSTRRHCFARSARTPSAVVQNTSARSRRTLRLSTRRVSPPVPGSTPSSGTSGRLTVEERSSIIAISSQASASS